MDSSVSAKDEIWFLRVCHQVSNALYIKDVVYVPTVPITVKPAMLTKSGMNLKVDMASAGLLTLPSLNMCKLFSAGHKNIIM
jgi:hypothetical protein